MMRFFNQKILIMARTFFTHIENLHRLSLSYKLSLYTYIFQVFFKKKKKKCSVCQNFFLLFFNIFLSILDGSQSNFKIVVMSKFIFSLSCKKGSFNFCLHFMNILILSFQKRYWMVLKTNQNAGSIV